MKSMNKQKSKAARSTTTLLLGLLLGFGPLTQAKADLSTGSVIAGGGNSFLVQRLQECSSRNQESPGGGSDEEATSEAGWQQLQNQYLSKTMSCTDKSAIEAMLSVTQITWVGVALASALAGLEPITVALIGAGAEHTFKVAELIVRNLPCRDDLSDSAKRRLIKQAVCEAMINQGYSCDPNGV